jgi:hypothetical protein
VEICQRSFVFLVLIACLFVCLEWMGDDVPCFCMTCRKRMMTLEEGRIRTWRLPAFSALLMALSASFRTEVFILASVSCGDSQAARRLKVSTPGNVSLQEPS